MCAKWGGLSLSLDAKSSSLPLNIKHLISSLNAMGFEPIAQHREKTLELNILCWTCPATLLTYCFHFDLKW